MIKIILGTLLVTWPLLVIMGFMFYDIGLKQSLFVLATCGTVVMSSILGIKIIIGR